jgi:hypothetical protein
LLVARESGPGRIAIKDGEQQNQVVGRLDFETRTGGRQRVRGATAWKIDRRNSWPVALQKHRAEFAVEELGVGCELAGTQARMTVCKLLFEPEF